MVARSNGDPGPKPRAIAWWSSTNSSCTHTITIYVRRNVLNAEANERLIRVRIHDDDVNVDDRDNNDDGYR